jgi:hypothetical protein
MGETVRGSATRRWLVDNMLRPAVVAGVRTVDRSVCLG